MWRCSRSEPLEVWTLHWPQGACSGRRGHHGSGALGSELCSPCPNGTATLLAPMWRRSDPRPRWGKLTHAGRRHRHPCGWLAVARSTPLLQPRQTGGVALGAGGAACGLSYTTSQGPRSSFAGPGETSGRGTAGAATAQQSEVGDVHGDPRMLGLGEAVSEGQAEGSLAWQ